MEYGRISSFATFHVALSLIFIFVCHYISPTQNMLASLFWFLSVTLYSTSYMSSPVKSADMELIANGLLNQLLNETVYNKKLRPNYGGPAVEVNVSMYVVAISSLSEIDMDFTMDFYFRQTWCDPRLAFEPAANLTELRPGHEAISKVWMPDLFVGNSKSIIYHELIIRGVSSSFMYIRHTGHVFFSTRLTVTAQCPMNLQYFPLDKQICKLNFESYSYAASDMYFQWRATHEALKVGPIYLPTFRIVNYTTREKISTIDTNTYSILECDFHFKRTISYYIYQIYVPACFIVVMSWIPFWLDRDHHARVALGVTTVLTMITLTANVMSNLPKVSYFKAIDVYLFVCFLMVFLALIEYATVGYMDSRYYSSQVTPSVTTRLPKWSPIMLMTRPESSIDHHSRLLFPFVFITFNILYATFMISIM